jgi:hypothetical protein
LRTAQIQHTVRQTRGFGQIVIIQLESRRDRSVQDFDLVANDFNLARAQIRIDRALRTSLNAAGNAQAVLITDTFGHFKGLHVVRVDDNLRQTLTVAQINENHTPVVAATMYPAKQIDRLAQVFFGNLAGITRTHLG